MKVKKFKKCRRFGSTIYEKCSSAKYAQSEEKRKFSGTRPKRPSEYGLKLIEKQKLRLSYGLKEKKLSAYIFDAINSSDETYQKIYENLEIRLDNVIYRLGLADSRAMAKQMVSHGHFTLNGRKFNIPSYAVKVGDKIAVREGSKDRAFFREIDKKDLRKMPKWLSFDFKALVGEATGKPEFDIKNNEFNFAQIIEFYTR